MEFQEALTLFVLGFWIGPCVVLLILTKLFSDNGKKRVNEILKNHFDMSGFNFTHGGIRYDVDRSIILAQTIEECENIDRRGRGLRVTRLFYDTILEYPFVVEWKDRIDVYSNKYQYKNYYVFYGRQALLDYCHEKFSNDIPNIMETDFSYPSFGPSDDEILRSHYGTNDYIPIMREQEEPVTA